MLFGFLACGTRQDETTVTEDGLAQLNPAIREAQGIPSVDAEHWENPILSITAEGISVRSKSRSERLVPGDELPAYLANLPLSDWRYGRVVAVGRPGVRSGAPDDESRIVDNVRTVEEVLNKLGLSVSWWPTA